jgi:hypothetical protein
VSEISSVAILSFGAVHLYQTPRLAGVILHVYESRSLEKAPVESPATTTYDPLLLVDGIVKAASRLSFEGRCGNSYYEIAARPNN